MEAHLVDVPPLHLLCPVEFLSLINAELEARIALRGVAQASGELLNLECWRLKELAEVIPKLPDVEQTFEALCFHIDLHWGGL